METADKRIKNQEENLINEIKKSAAKADKDYIIKQAKPKLANIKLEKLHRFENHPYKVLDDESMKELIESIKEYGLLNRIIVRPIDDKPDEYEIISGHRRVHAAERLGIKEVPAVIYFKDKDEATVLMVDSNCQRENLTLMEKARSYRMKSDALSHQGKTLGQNVPKSENNRTAAKIGAKGGESYKTVQRLIRLTYLVPELQEYVDSGKMKMLPAYELSFIDEEAQRDIVDRIDETGVFPSHSQTRRIRKAFEEGRLDYDAATEIMNEFKLNQAEKLRIPMDKIRNYLPENATPKDIAEYLVTLIKQDYERRQHSRNNAR